jgi:YD repeat-containing protein
VTEGGVLVRSYGYDANGNRLSLTGPGLSLSGTYDAQDRVLTYGTASYSHDRDGFLSEKVAGTDTTRYVYDALGNLLRVTLPGGPTIEYVVDGESRRVGRKVNGVLQQGWLWQSDLAPAAQLDSTGAVVSRFVYGTRPNVPDYLVKSGVTYRLVLDQLGSVRLVVSTTDGTVAQRIDYDEFGRVTQNSNPGFQPFGFAGGLYDDQTGLLRFGARD